MKVVFVLLALQQIALSTSQLKLTPAEHKAFLKALDGRRPLYFQSAIPIAKYKNLKTDGKFAYLDIGGKYGKTLFLKPIHVERGVVDAEYGPSGGPIKEQIALSSKAYSSDSFPPIYRNDVVNLMPIKKRPHHILRIKNSRKRREAEAKVDNKDKRQTDDDDAEDEDYEDEEPLTYREELSFGLSTAGGVIGGAFGGFLDTTGQATLKLIGSVESLGLIGVTQFDSFLDRAEKEKQAREERNKLLRYKASQAYAYGVPKPTYGAPKPVYGAPKDPIPSYSAPNLQTNIVYSPPKLSYNVPQTPVKVDIDSGETTIVYNSPTSTK